MTVVNRVRQTYCGLHGHDALLHFETGRLSMRCTSCGHETPGWEIIEARRSAPVKAGDTQSHAMIPAHLADGRRIA